MRYFIDTNIFLRLLIKEDEKTYSQCYKLLSAVKTIQIKAVTSSITLAEIVWTLSSYYKFPKRKVVRAVKSILNLKGVKIIDAYNPSVSLELFDKYTVKYIDTLIASVKKIADKKWIVVSYDRDFDKLAIERKEPHEILEQMVN